jgi:hypothetical protein
MSEEYQERLQARIAELKAKIGKGGLRECIIRGMLYVGSARGMVDERGLEALRRVRMEETGSRLSLADFKTLVREQFFMLLLEPDASLAAIPKLLPKSAETRRAGFGVIRDVLSASAAVSGEAASRLKRVQELFGIASEEAASAIPYDPQAKAS